MTEDLLQKSSVQNLPQTDGVIEPDLLKQGISHLGL